MKMRIKKEKEKRITFTDTYATTIVTINISLKILAFIEDTHIYINIHRKNIWIQNIIKWVSG